MVLLNIVDSIVKHMGKIRHADYFPFGSGHWMVFHWIYSCVSINRNTLPFPKMQYDKDIAISRISSTLNCGQYHVARYSMITNDQSQIKLKMSTES